MSLPSRREALAALAAGTATGAALGGGGGSREHGTYQHGAARCRRPLVDYANANDGYAMDVRVFDLDSGEEISKARYVVEVDCVDGWAAVYVDGEDGCPRPLPEWPSMRCPVEVIHGRFALGFPPDAPECLTEGLTFVRHPKGFDYVDPHGEGRQIAPGAHVVLRPRGHTYVSPEAGERVADSNWTKVSGEGASGA